MPIDASIPLAIQPPPAISPFAAMQQAQNFALGRESALALRQERLASAAKTQQETARMARENADEQAVRQWFAAIQPGQAISDDQVNDLASKVGPDRAQKIAEGLDAVRQKHLKTEGDVRTMLGSVIGGIQALPQNMQADAYNNVVQEYGRRGLLDPTQVKPFSPEVLEEYRLQAMTPDQQATEARAQAEQTIKLKNDAASVLGTATDAQDYAAKLGQTDPRVARLFPPVQAWTPQLSNTIRSMGMSSAEQTTAAQQATNAAETKRHNTAEEGTQRQNAATAAGELALKTKQFNATFGANLHADGSPMTPDEIKQTAANDPQATMIANYQVPAPSSRIEADPKYAGLFARIKALNPAYDATMFASRQKARNDFSPGGLLGQQVGAMNTAVQHLDLLSQAAAALQNGSFTPGNALYNKVASLFGASGPLTYAQVSHFVDGEIGNVVKKGAVTDKEMTDQQATSSGANSPAQLTAHINNAIQILGSKTNTLHYQAKTALGDQDPVTQKMVMPEVGAILQQRGFNPDGTKISAPSGAAPTEVQSLLKGQKDGRYTLSDGSKWVVKNGEVVGKG